MNNREIETETISFRTCKESVVCKGTKKSMGNHAFKLVIWELID